MKIQIFEAIKRGIDLSFKNKMVLGLIVLYSILGIASALLIEPFMVEPKGLNEVVIPPTLPAFGTNEGLTIFASLVVSIIILYAIVKIVFENLNKREISISAAMVSVLKKIIPILVASIIYSIIVVLGLIALVIPGVFLSVVLVFYGQAILLNNKGVISSLKESRNIVKGNWWRLFALLLVFIMISLLLGLFLGFLSWFFGWSLYLTDTIVMISSFFASGIMMVVYTIVYFQLIGKEEKIVKQGVVGEIVQEKR